MIDHIMLNVKDHAKALAFYKTVLAPLGYTSLQEFPGFAILAEASDGDVFALAEGEPTPMHFAFGAATHELVDEFYKLALENGGKDNGAPGPRPDYGPNYYAAFVIDPDGYRIEAVCHK